MRLIDGLKQANINQMMDHLDVTLILAICLVVVQLMPNKLDPTTRPIVAAVAELAVFLLLMMLFKLEDKCASLVSFSLTFLYSTWLSL